MFKNLNITFEKRKIILAKSEDKEGKINKSLSAFLKNEFGEKKYGLIRTAYDYKNNSLIITADNKILANELVLKLSDLSDFLRTDSIALNRILIR